MQRILINSVDNKTLNCFYILPDKSVILKQLDMDSPLKGIVTFCYEVLGATDYDKIKYFQFLFTDKFILSMISMPSSSHAEWLQELQTKLKEKETLFTLVYYNHVPWGFKLEKEPSTVEEVLQLNEEIELASKDFLNGVQMLEQKRAEN